MRKSWKSRNPNVSHQVKTMYGQLSNDDIMREYRRGSLVIEPNPKDNGNLNAASLDITPSCVIMSVRKGRLEKIYSEPAQCPHGYPIPGKVCDRCQYHKNLAYGRYGACSKVNRYVLIHPRDTVLVLSREYIQVPNYICGNVYSRVSNVSAGLGHISTTIDPGWRGALLIAVSNPSSEWKRLTLYDESGRDVPLATVTFSYLHSPATLTNADKTHLPARVDIMERYLTNAADYKSRKAIFKRACSKFLHIKEYRLTVSTIEKLNRLQSLSAKEWPEKLAQIEEQISAHIVPISPWRKISHFVWKCLLGIPVALLICVLSCMVFKYVAYGDSAVDKTEIVALISSIILMILKEILTKFVEWLRN